MNILIIGVGYVGLVSGTCFAEMGNRVTCLDINENYIAQLKEGAIPIYEPGLEEMVKRNIQAGRLHFTTDYPESIAKADVCFIAVDTPISGDGSANLMYVNQVAKSIGDHLENYCVIVTKSTVPVGTTFQIKEIIKNRLRERQLSTDFAVVSNPEFLKEGNAINDFMKPDRVILGVETLRAADIMKKLYEPFMHNHERLLIMDIKSAELSKYAANAMLASRISFMNEMAGLCELLGADIGWIRKAIGSDERIGNKFLYPGVGFGGSCFPKDISALIHQGKQVDYSLEIVKAVEDVNLKQKKVIGQKIIHYFLNRGGLKDKVIGVLGLSFKPDTDDMRAAPSLTLIDTLIHEGAKIRVFDPIAMNKAKIILTSPQITWCANEMEAASGAHALVLMTEWKQFRLLNFQTVSSVMKGNAFFDGRNQYKQIDGFDYFSIGRSPVYSQIAVQEEIQKSDSK